MGIIERALSNFSSFLTAGNSPPLIVRDETRGVVKEQRDWYRYPSIKEATNDDNAHLINPYLQTYGEVPHVDFRRQLLALQDPVLNASCDFFAEMIAGPGLWVSSSNTPIGNLAERIIEEFFEAIDIDTLMLQTSKAMMAFGNEFHKKITPTDLLDVQRIPLTSIHRIKRQETPAGALQVMWYQQRLGGLYELVDPAEVIHYRWNPEDNHAFGVGLVTKLCLPAIYNVTIGGLNVTKTRPPLMDIKSQLQDDIRLSQHRRIPRNAFLGPTLTYGQKAELQNDLQSIEADQDIVSRAPELTIQELGVRGRGTDVDASRETNLDDIQIGMQTPVIRLFTTPGFTEASAQEATDMVMRKVNAAQRFEKRVMEIQYIRPVLYQSGFTDQDIIQSEIKVNWGSPDPQPLLMADFATLNSQGVFERDEVRRYLAKNYKVELEDTWSQGIINPQKPIAAPATPSPFTAAPAPTANMKPGEMLRLEKMVNESLLARAQERKKQHGG